MCAELTGARWQLWLFGSALLCRTQPAPPGNDALAEVLAEGVHGGVPEEALAQPPSDAEIRAG